MGKTKSKAGETKISRGNNNLRKAVGIVIAVLGVTLGTLFVLYAAVTLIADWSVIGVWGQTWRLVVVVPTIGVAILNAIGNCVELYNE